MDDRDLEARLSAHLHRRFDDARPPAELAPNIRQAFATQARRLSLRGLGAGSPMRLGFSLTAAAAAVVVLAVAGSNLGLHFGPGAGDQPSPSPTPITGPAQRFFIVLPPTTTLPSKADSGVASDVLTARLSALGVGNFTTATGNGITLTLPVAGPSDDVVRAVLAAPGVVQFIPIPASDPAVAVGEALPHPYPVLFGSDGVATVRDGTDQNGNPALDITLAPPASRLIADYTTNHIGEQLAIVVDGRVAAAPIIQSAIVGGNVQITNESSTGGFALGAPLRAILIGGALPPSWRGAQVPIVISRAAAIEAAAGSAHVTVQSAELVAAPSGNVWRAVWDVVLLGDFAASCPRAALPSNCAGATSRLVVLDAISGAFISSQEPAP